MKRDIEFIRLKALSPSQKIMKALSIAYSEDVANNIFIMALNPNYTVQHVADYISWFKTRIAMDMDTGFDLWLAEAAPEETGASSPKRTNKKED